MKSAKNVKRKILIKAEHCYLQIHYEYFLHGSVTCKIIVEPDILIDILLNLLYKNISLATSQLNCLCIIIMVYAEKCLY